MLVQGWFDNPIYSYLSLPLATCAMEISDTEYKVPNYIGILAAMLLVAKLLDLHISI